MLASGCIDNQYRKGKETVVINIHFKDANLFAVGDTTYASFFKIYLYMGLYWDCNHFTNFQRDIQVGKNGDFGPLGWGASKNNHSPYAHLNVVGIATIFHMNQ